MSVTDELLKNAARYAGRFDKGDLAKPPARRVAIIACMDARLAPYALLGLSEGDAHVIRNAGGVVGDEEIRALAISQRVLGTREVVLIRHTDCGMLGFDDEEFKHQLTEETGVEPTWTAQGLSDLDGGLRESIASIEASPFVPHTDSVRGFVYDVRDGSLREV
jgi:carbonic anhydrase